MAAKKHRVAPELDFTCSSSLFPPDFDTETKLRHALPSGLAIINGVTKDVRPEALEAAYGLGARLPSPTDHFSRNRQFVAIHRPFFRKFPKASPKLCYFTVPVCRGVSVREGTVQVRLKTYPISADSRLPVIADLHLGPADTMGFWLPLPYPAAMMDLTADERRYLNLRIIWSSSARRRMEILAFPRVSGAFRVLQSTPHFRVTPPLNEDPAPWDTGRSGKFVLDGTPSDNIRTGSVEESLISLTLDDVVEIRTRFLKQIWWSIVAGVAAGTSSSLLTESIDDIPLWVRICGAVAAIFFCIAALLPLLPRNRLSRL